MIHGVGEQGPDFAVPARIALKRALAGRKLDLWARSVHWAPYADIPQKRYLASVEAAGSRGNATQRLVVGTLADALMYHTNERLRSNLFRLLDRHLVSLGHANDLRRPTTIFAHSLGGLIATDWLRARPDVSGVQLVTFGCNIGLFTLGESFEPVPQLRAPGSWVNLFSPRDMLGFPLAVDPALAHVLDVKIGVGGWFTGWTGLAHVRYWDDKKLWSRTIPNLLAP